MCEIDLEPCEVWTQTTRIARKPHRCSGCEATIPPGDRYYRTFYIFEGEAGYTKHCGACQRDIKAFARAHEGVVPSPSGFDFVLEECIDNAEGPQEARRWKAMLARQRARAAPPPQGRAQPVGADPSPLGASGPAAGPVGR